MCLLSNVLSNNKTEKMGFPVTLAGVAIIGALLVFLIAPSCSASSPGDRTCSTRRRRITDRRRGTADLHRPVHRSGLRGTTVE